MKFCCCSMAGTRACKRCPNNDSDEYTLAHHYNDYDILKLIERIKRLEDANNDSIRSK